MTAPPASALIVRLSSIGDVVHTLPAYMALHEAWPAARLGWAVEPVAAALVRRLPGSPTVHELDTQRWRRRWWRSATRRELGGALAALRAPGYEVALDFQGLIKSAIVARLSGAEVLGLAPADLREPLARRWYDRAAPPTDPDAHVVFRGLGLAAAAGAATAAAPRFPRLFDDEDEARVGAALRRRDLGRFAVVHAAANWPSKRWPPARLATVAAGLYRRAGLPVLWIWGPGEEPEARRLALVAGEGSAVSFPTTLPELAALLSRAALFVGGDSAPLHLAVAQQTPTVGIFGPTSPQRLGPLRDTDPVAVSRQPCSFCHQRRCPLGTRACLESLPAEAVLEAALRRLETPAGRAG